MRTDLPDPYRVLGVSETASAADIKKAYRRLAKENHPDSNDGCKTKEARFKDVSAAYEILGNPERRSQYDQLKSAGPGAMPGGITDIGDLFNQMFGGGQASGAGASRGGVRYQVYRGGQGGPGPQAPGSMGGFPFGDLGSLFGASGQTRPPPRPRAAPRPSRQVPTTKPKKPKKPKRVILSDGTSARVCGLDIHTDVRIGVDEAILGTTATVVTHKGKAKLRIPPGTGSGARLRLRQKGLMHRDGRQGDHYVTVGIDVPSKISDEAARLLAEFMDNVKKEMKAES